MGEYLTIIWEPETPAAQAVAWDNSMLVVHGSEASMSETTRLACTSEDWSTILVNAGFGATDQAYKSVGNFFAANPTPGGTLYVLGLVSGTVDSYDNVPMRKITDILYETPIKPPLGFHGAQEVRYYPDATLTGYFTNAADGSVGVGFTIVNDDIGNWTGRLNFLNGLSGFEIDSPPLAGCKVTCSFNIGSAMADVDQAIEDLNIGMMAAAYENTNAKTAFAGSNTYYGSMVDDLSRFMGAIAGKQCLFFWGLPGGANPTDTASGFGDTWGNIKTLLGAREDVALLKASPSATGDDMGVGYMGMTAGEHPHSTLSFKTLHMGISQAEGLINRAYWNDAQVASPMERRELVGNPNLISHGFTLGVGYSSRVNYVRCKNIISQEIKNTIWALFASRKVRMSYAGMQLTKASLTGLFKRLTSQGIIDGLAYVRIPIANDLKNNTAAGRAARAIYTIPSIEIGFYWYSSLEKIIITGITNEA